jgi:hypothetical protein
MAAETGWKQWRNRRALVVHLDALATNRIVIEVPPSGAERSVAIGLVNPPATQCETVTIDTLAAEIHVVEIEPNQAPMTVRVVTAVPGDAAYDITRTFYQWPDLVDEPCRGRGVERVN